MEEEFHTWTLTVHHIYIPTSDSPTTHSAAHLTTNLSGYNPRAVNARLTSEGNASVFSFGARIEGDYGEGAQCVTQKLDWEATVSVDFNFPGRVIRGLEPTLSGLLRTPNRVLKNSTFPN